MNPEKPKPNGSHQIQRMLPRHFKMVDLHVAGLTNRAVAEILGCTPTSVGMILRSPIVKKEVERRIAEERDSPNGTIVQEIEAADNRARRIIEDNAPLAAQTMVDLMDSEDDSVKFRSSGSILDRAIGRPDSQNAGDGLQLKIEISAPDAQLLMIALKESKETPSNGQVNESATDGQDADSTPDEQGDVHQTPQCSTGVGHRQTQAQAPQAGREVKLVTNLSQLGNSSTDDPESTSAL